MAVQPTSNGWIKVISQVLWGLVTLCTASWTGATPWSNVQVTDVTPSSFTLTWQASEAASGTVELFADVMGTQPVSSATITPFYLGSGSDGLKNRMINAGIVRVRVSSLVPNTPYFYRLVTTPTTTGVDLIKPAAGPYHSVVTAQRAFVASNDTAGLSVLNASGTTPAPGSLVIMQVEGSPYPLSAIAGDGYSGGFTGINLSNLYPTEQSLNRELNGGEHAVLTVKAGSGMGAQVTKALGGNQKLADLQNLGTLILTDQSTDSDGDGMPDAWELAQGLNPEIPDGDGDPDGDGLSNLEEYHWGTDPQQADSDGDGLSDGDEVTTYNTVPTIGDSDRDGVLDGEEVDTAIGTDPLNADSDGDGVSDGDEIVAGTDPKDSQDTPVLDKDGDGVGDLIDNCPLIPNPTQINTDGDAYGDACDSDDDNDGIPDVDDNAPLHANPDQADGDLDGVGDVGDNCPSLFNPEQRDNDGDGLGDDCDPDDDNDGINDMLPAAPPSEMPYKLRRLIRVVADNLPASNHSAAFISFGKRDHATGEQVVFGYLNLRTREFQANELTEAQLAANGTLTAYLDTNSCDCIVLQARTFITLETDQGVVTVYLPKREQGDESHGTIIAEDGSSYRSQYIESGKLVNLLQSAQIPTPLDNCQFTYNPDQSDVDGDGIGDLCDATPEDVDGDGVLNSYDNCPNTHNPNQADFDGDGIGNVCDSDNDNDGIDDVIEALLGTNHLSQDSDGDGILDGDEDYDLDGTSNRDELLRGSNPLVSDVRFETGLNYFSFPVDVPAGLTASGFVQQLGGHAAVVSIQRYDEVSRQAQTYAFADGAWRGQDFPIVSGKGYFIELKVPVEAEYDSLRTCLSLNLKPGANVVGFSCITGELTAYQVLEMLGGETQVSTIQRYNRELGRFESAGYSEGNEIGVNFLLNNQEAYIVNLRTEVSAFALAVQYPNLNVTSHTLGQTVSSPEVVLRGLVDDTHALVLVNGKLASLNAIGSSLEFSATLQLDEGINEIHLLTRGGANLVSTSTFRLNYAVPPEFSVDSHVNGQDVYGSIVTLVGTVSDAGAKVVVNGIQGVVTGNQFVVSGIALQPGTNAVNLVVTGSNGGRATRSLNLNYQSLQVTLPAGGSELSSVTIKVAPASWSAFSTYSWSPVLPPGLSFENESATRLSPNNEIRFSYRFRAVASMAPGQYSASVTYQLKSSTGVLLQTQVFDFHIEVIDNAVSPTITITAPVDGATVRKTPYTVTGTVSDSTAIVKVNGSVAVVTGNSFSASVALVPGANSIHVTAENAYGSASRTIAVTFEEDLAPTLVVTAPVEGQVLTKPEVTIYGTVTNATSVTVNGVSATIDGAQFSVDLALQEGVNIIAIVAANSHGTTEHSISVTVVPNVPNELSVTVGGQVAGQHDFITTAVLWGQVANFSYSSSGAPSFLTFAPTGGTLLPPNMVRIPYQVQASGIATPGDYTLTLNFQFLNSSGTVLFSDAMLITVRITP